MVFIHQTQKKINLLSNLNNITFKEVMNKDLKVMDMTAFTLSEENNLPIIVFDMNKEGNLTKVVLGENIGTLVNS